MKVQRVVSVGPGPAARLQLSALRVVAALLRPFGSKGFSPWASFVAKAFSARNHAKLELSGGLRLKVNLNDPYWLSPLLTGRPYEPEMAKILDRVLDDECAFVDCGANIGYWSAIAARRIGRTDRVIAIEAAFDSYERLRENASVNGDGFRPIHAAVWNASGQELSVATDPIRHSWASVDPDLVPRLREAGFKQELVESITVDDSVERFLDDRSGRLILKVDVEGAELQVLEGAVETLRGDTLLAYEDHGNDPECRVTEAVMALGLVVFAHEEPTGVTRFTDIVDVKALKKDSGRGYNFFACREGTRTFDLMDEMADVYQG